MHSKAFVIAGGTAAMVANDGCDFRYRASAQYIPVGVQIAACSHAHADMQFLVEDGIVEFMIGGVTAIVFAGDFVRVPAGVIYAWRNAGDATAQLLVRSVNPAPARRAMQITIN